MRAVRIAETGGPEQLTVDDVTVPEPGPDEVRVRVEAAGINFIDTYQRNGAYPVELPATLGVEGAGTVDAVGNEVDELDEGDRVAWAMTRGSYAEYAVVPAAGLVVVPAEIELPTAAAVLLQGLTAHYLAHSTYLLGSDDTALVHAAAGGVGQLLVQVAKRRGATVIGTTSTDEKAEFARQAGADEVIRYTATTGQPAGEVASRDGGDFADEVAARVGVGIDVVYDSVGAATFERSMDCLRPRGLMVLFGQSSGPVGPLDPQVLNQKGSLYLTRPNLSHYVAHPAELAWRAADVFSWMATGELAVRVDGTWPLAQAAEAHRFLEERRSKGKLLLTP